jgi:hypothetical protein
MNTNNTQQGKVFSAEEVLRRNMSVAFDDEANQPFLAEMIKCMEQYASQSKETTLPSQPVKEVSTHTVLTKEQLIAEAKKMYIPNSSLSRAETEAAIKAHIHAGKMYLQLTQQERRDIAEKSLKDYIDWYGKEVVESWVSDQDEIDFIENYLNTNYPLNK